MAKVLRCALVVAALGLTAGNAAAQGGGVTVTLANPTISNYPHTSGQIRADVTISTPPGQTPLSLSLQLYIQTAGGWAPVQGQVYGYSGDALANNSNPSTLFHYWTPGNYQVRAIFRTIPLEMGGFAREFTGTGQMYGR